VRLRTYVCAFRAFHIPSTASGISIAFACWMDGEKPTNRNQPTIISSSPNRSGMEWNRLQVKTFRSFHLFNQPTHNRIGARRLFGPFWFITITIGTFPMPLSFFLLIVLTNILLIHCLYSSYYFSGLISQAQNTKNCFDQ
jgi:hypothetical protein